MPKQKDEITSENFLIRLVNRVTGKPGDWSGDMWILERQATRLSTAIDCQIMRLMDFRLKLTHEQFDRLRRLSCVSDKAHARANRRFYKAYMQRV